MDHWHHSPSHLFLPNRMYIVTAGTYQKQHFFRGNERLQLVQTALLNITQAYQWQIQAWAILSNHYHFIAQAPDDSSNLKKMIQCLHSRIARAINEMDKVAGRKVWFQYWDTCLTYEKSYYARLNYVHQNAVHHGLVQAADRYEFCSAGWFECEADRSFQNKIKSFQCDHVKVPDDF